MALVTSVTILPKLDRSTRTIDAVVSDLTWTWWIEVSGCARRR
jgi:hypothetical protein